jgi:hypothetical protein
MKEIKAVLWPVGPFALLIWGIGSPHRVGGQVHQMCIYDSFRGKEVITSQELHSVCREMPW